MNVTRKWWSIYRHGLNKLIPGLFFGFLLIASVPLAHGFANRQKMNKLLYLAWPLAIVAGIIVTGVMVAAMAAWTVAAAVTLPIALIGDAVLGIVNAIFKMRLYRTSSHIDFSLEKADTTQPSKQAANTATIVAGLGKSKSLVEIHVEAKPGISPVAESPSASTAPAPALAPDTAATPSPTTASNDASLVDAIEKKAVFS